jgi:uncharacterized protein YuzE
MKKHFSYEPRYDILAVHNGFVPGEKFETNAVIGDIVLDISTKGKIVGVEILNATSFLKEFVSEGFLGDLYDADLDVSQGENSVTLSLILKTKEQQVPAKIAVPLSYAI